MTGRVSVMGIDVVKQRHAAAIMGRSDVSAFGIGRDSSGRDCLIVHVTRAYPEGQQLPAEIEGYRVVIMKSRPFRRFAAPVRLRKAR